MKKTIVIIVASVILIVSGYIVYLWLSSRSLSPRENVSYSANGLDVKVVYCRPFKRGRLIFGDAQSGALLPYGKYWRLGANDATEITFSKDVNVNGKPLKAGSYRMYAVPDEQSWAITFNSELGAWGYNEPNHELDVVTIAVPVEKVSTETEQFTIRLANDSTGMRMNFDWEKTHLSVPIVAL